MRPDRSFSSGAVSYGDRCRRGNLAQLIRAVRPSVPARTRTAGEHKSSSDLVRSVDEYNAKATPLMSRRLFDLIEYYKRRLSEESSRKPRQHQPNQRNKRVTKQNGPQVSSTSAGRPKAMESSLTIWRGAEQVLHSSHTIGFVEKKTAGELIKITAPDVYVQMPRRRWRRERARYLAGWRGNLLRRGCGLGRRAGRGRRAGGPRGCAAAPRGAAREDVAERAPPRARHGGRGHGGEREGDQSREGRKALQRARWAAVAAMWGMVSVGNKQKDWRGITLVLAVKKTNDSDIFSGEGDGDYMELPDVSEAKGAVTPVKNQGRLGSCGAFTTVATVESIHYIKKGKLAPQLEHQLVGCVNKKETINNGGCTTEQYCPNTGQEVKCNQRYHAAMISEFKRIDDNNDPVMMAGEALHGGRRQVNHQGRLGSYQAFAAVAMVESLHRIKTAKLDPFMLGQLLKEEFRVVAAEACHQNENHLPTAYYVIAAIPLPVEVFKPRPDFSLKVESLKATEDHAVRDQVALSMRLLSLLGSPEEPANLAFSPLSFHVVLSLLTSGASGATRDKIIAFVGSASAYAHATLASKGSRGPLRHGRDVALSPNPAFADAAASDFKASVRAIGFGDNPAAARAEINDWFAKETGGFVKNLLAENAIDAHNGAARWQRRQLPLDLHEHRASTLYTAMAFGSINTLQLNRLNLRKPIFRNLCYSSDDLCSETVLCVCSLDHVFIISRGSSEKPSRHWSSAGIGLGDERHCNVLTSPAKPSGAGRRRGRLAAAIKIVC
ncbi:hypothetical protein HU200_058006 [Digitaria exilis]|uniref:Peptidase C1A papain C-terminal domain-containing protein n=1 Tax=Digitaria exilis TaxID=1010633 RepID=A0A835ADL1_9POAL|nr:hypothetical protein HU200_058006 [Digitaria exilis]